MPYWTKRSGTGVLATALLAVVGLGAACDDGTPAGPDGGLTTEELAEVALDGDAVAGGILFVELFGSQSGGPARAAADVREFSRSRPCRDGGTIELQGTVSRSENGDGTVEATITGTRSQVSCTRIRGDVTLVVDGTGTFSAYRKRVNGEPVGNQTSEYQGSFDWTRSRGDEARTGSCTYQIQSVRNPDSMKVRVTGTICGHEIDRERDWTHGT